MYKVSVNENSAIEMELQNGEVELINSDASFDIEQRADSEYHLLVNGKSLLVHIDKIDWDEKSVQARVNGKTCTIQITDKMDLLLKSMGLENAMATKMNELKAPMPGLVLDILVEPGTTVEKGTPLLVLEAMKMENVIKAAGDGTVKEIKISAKDAVDKNQVMITFE